MNWRVFHRRIALVYSPFLILTSLTGIVLLFRKDGLYSAEVKDLLLGLHNWEIAAKYVGAVLGLGLILISTSGLFVYFKSKKF